MFGWVLDRVAEAFRERFSEELEREYEEFRVDGYRDGYSAGVEAGKREMLGLLQEEHLRDRGKVLSGEGFEGGSEHLN